MRHRNFLLLFLMIPFVSFIASESRAETTPISNSNFEMIFSTLRQKAKANSPDLKFQESQLKQKTAGRYSSFSKFLPRVDATINQSTSKDYSLLTSGPLGALLGPQYSPTETTLKKWNLQASAPLFRKSVFVQSQVSQDEYNEATVKLSTTKKELFLKLRQTLGQFLLAGYQFQLLQNSLEVTKRQNEEISAGFRLGQKTRLDVLKNEATLKTLEAQLALRLQEKLKSYQALLDFLGIDESELNSLDLLTQANDPNWISSTFQIFVGTETSTQTRPSSEFPREFTRWISLSDKPDLFFRELQKAEPTSLRLLDIQRQIQVSRASQTTVGEWPELSLQGSLSKQSDNWSTTFSSGNLTYSYGIFLNIPIFSWGGGIATFLDERSAKITAETSFEKSKRTLTYELLNQARYLTALQVSVEAQKAALIQQEEIVRLSQKSLDLGRATLTELLNSQKELLDAKIQVSKVQLDLHIATLKFGQDLGFQQEEL